VKLFSSNTFTATFYNGIAYRTENADKKRVDETKLLGIPASSIPAKPLAQAKLKCGGFFIAAIAAGRLGETHQTCVILRATGSPSESSTGAPAGARQPVAGTPFFNLRPKSDAAKMALAAQLRRKTTLTVRDIAQRLHMGSRQALSSKLHHWMKTHENQT
jgi:hypothetical protein